MEFTEILNLKCDKCGMINVDCGLGVLKLRESLN